MLRYLQTDFKMIENSPGTAKSQDTLTDEKCVPLHMRKVSPFSKILIFFGVHHVLNYKITPHWEFVQTKYFSGFTKL